MRIETGPWEDGSTAEFESFIDEKFGIVGFKCLVNGKESYLYFNPSSGGDSPDLFVYEGEHGDPSKDIPLTFFGFPAGPLGGEEA